MNKKCIIFGAGEFNSAQINYNEADLIIAADGGYNHLRKLNIVPDILIGDFDSLNIIPTVDKIIKLNKIKDDTDMIAAINSGIENGCNEFHIYGGTGGRIEHTFANIQTIANLSKHNYYPFLYTDNEIITAVTDMSLCFSENYRGYISVFAHDGQVEGVTLKNLKYLLDDVKLSNTYPLGVSNEFINKKSTVAVRQGTLIIVYEHQTIASIDCPVFIPITGPNLRT